METAADDDCKHETNCLVYCPMLPGEVSYFLLIAADLERSGRSSPSAHMLIRHRFAAGVWGINAGTKYRNRFKPGDRILAYAAGSREFGKHFVGYTTILSRDDRPSKQRVAVATVADEMQPDSCLLLESSFLFLPPIDIRSVMAHLSFIKPSIGSKWGIYLQGGAVELPRVDFEKIVEGHNAVATQGFGLDRFER